jgi:hypothetical protein
MMLLRLRQLHKTRSPKQIEKQGAFKKKKQKTGVPTYLPFFEIF